LLTRRFPHPLPNRACDFYRTRHSKVQHSSPEITLGSVSPFDFTGMATTIQAAADTHLRPGAGTMSAVLAMSRPSPSAPRRLEGIKFMK
jgi:hypothetical protein